MKANKHYRFIMTQARLEAEQHGSDGGAIRFIKATLNVEHDSAVKLWFNYAFRRCNPQPNGIYLWLAALPAAERRQCSIVKSSRTLIVFGKPVNIFNY